MSAGIPRKFCGLHFCQGEIRILSVGKYSIIAIMKPILKIIFISCAVSVSSSVYAEGTSTDQVSISATLGSAPSRLSNPGKGGKEGSPDESTKFLNIEFRGSKDVPKNVTVTTTFYGRDLGKKTTVVQKELQNSVEFDSSFHASLKTADVTFTYTPEHSQNEGKKGRKNGSNGNKKKKVEASGTRFYGWTVRVKQGDVLLGEAASLQPLLKVGE